MSNLARLWVGALEDSWLHTYCRDGLPLSSRGLLRPHRRLPGQRQPSHNCVQVRGLLLGQICPLQVRLSDLPQS